jgi:transposase
MTVVMDLKTGAIVHTCEGRDSAALRPFLLRLRKARVKLKAIAIDMSASYTKAIVEVFGSSVKLVYDRFHVTALINKGIDEIRRRIQQELTDDERKTLKGCRFVLLKGSERLDEDAAERLKKIKQTNETLYEAYLLKERFRTFWTLSDRVEAERFMCEWVGEVIVTTNKTMMRVAKTLLQHLEGLLAYFDEPITTAKLEGTNNKIKVLKRQAYGFRDMDYFKLRLMFLHESKLKLVG